MKKKTLAKKTNRPTRSLPTKTLTSKEARDVKGGNLMKYCATGKHIAKATL